MKNKVWPILMLAMVAGCNDNPYPNAGSDISKDKPNPVRTVRPAISVDFSERVFSFTEGTEDFYKLNAKVPTGKAVVTLKGLPEGAVYEKRRVLIDEHPSDPSQNVYQVKEGLFWTPSTKTIDTELNPELRERIFDVDVYVHAAHNPSVKSSFKIFLKVANTRQLTKLTMGTNWDSLDVKEGETDSLTLKIESLDFPTGDFDLMISPKIQGLQYEPIQGSPGEYKVTFSPSFNAMHVKDCAGSSWNCKKSFDVNFRVIEPDNHTTKITKKVTFSDSRQEVAASTPDNIEMGLNGSFQFLSSDPNNEVEPRVELSGLEPEFGKFEMESISFTATNKSTLTKIKWTDIPQSMVGQSETLSFRVCNYDYDDFDNQGNNSSDPSRCITRSVEIDIVQNEKPAPSLVRDTWNANERKYLLVGERLNETIEFEIGQGEDDPKIELVKPKAVADGQGGDIIENKVKIMQIGNRIRMEIEAVKPGPAQFTIKLTSSYGVQHAESFIYEVLPADWSSILVLGESKRSKEQKNLEPNIENYDFINPFNTALKFPLTLKRDTIVIGTDILKDMPDDQFFTNIFENFKNVIFASPLIGELPQIVLQKFGEQKVEPKNDRIKQQDPNIDLNNVELVVEKAVITLNNGAASVKGDSTNESTNPATLFVKRNSTCKVAMFLADNTAQKEYPLTAVCKRGGGGNIVLMGTEWGEFEMEAAEKALPQTWFKELMKVEFN